LTVGKHSLTLFTRLAWREDVNVMELMRVLRVRKAIEIEIEMD